MRSNISNLTQMMRKSNVAYWLFLEIVGGITLSFFSLLLFIKLTDDVLEKELFSFDTNVMHFVYSLRNPILTQIMIVISYLGNEVILLGSALLLIFLARKHYKKEALLFSFIVGMGAVLNFLLKFLIHRPRPTLFPLIHVNSYSFPSGHSMNSLIFYATLSYLFFRVTKNKKLSIIVAILSTFLILLIGLSRIYLGVHYPSDVLAGYVAGLFWFATVIVLERTIAFFKIFKQSEEKAQ